MTLQNRVTPFGEIVANRARGQFMGNRGGRLHTEDKQLTGRRWVSRRWICCVTEFRGWWREVMGNGYTELFFLDESTALAAGHRPCAFCRRQDYRRFVEAWSRAAGMQGPAAADVIDRVLHEERVGPRREKRTFTAAAGSLPPGTFVTFAETPGDAFITWGGELYPWRFEGYGEAIGTAAGAEAFVLTPRSIVAAFEAGYVPRGGPAIEGRAGTERPRPS